MPASAAQEVIDLLVEAEVKAILNYAPKSVVVPSGVRVQHVDPVVSLQSMTYYLNPDAGQEPRPRDERRLGT